MKQITLILSALVMLTACKKNNEPAPQPAQTTATNNGNTNPTNPNDTAGKVKIFYSLQTNPVTVGYGVGCSGRDYIQDTNNVRMYHNTTQLHNHFVSMRTVPDGVGLNVLENGTISGLSHTLNPLWCNVGDSSVGL